MLSELSARFRRNATLLDEIEKPTENLVCEGIFYTMLYGKTPTWPRVAKAIVKLDRSASIDAAEDRIADAVLGEAVAVRFTDNGDALVFPTDIRDWWKVTLRYLINYCERIDENRSPDGRLPKVDPYTRQLFEVVAPHLDSIFATNQLPDYYPWKES